MKKLIQLLIKFGSGGFDGLFGTDFVKLVDDNGDNKIQPIELIRNYSKVLNYFKSMSIGQWARIAVSLGTTVGALLNFVK